MVALQRALIAGVVVSVTIVVVVVAAVWWKTMPRSELHRIAQSPSGDIRVESWRELRPGLFEDVSVYELRTVPPHPFRCLSEPNRFFWVSSEWSDRHRYAHLDDREDPKRGPTSLEWISKDRFRVICRDGDSFLFELQ